MNNNAMYMNFDDIIDLESIQLKIHKVIGYEKVKGISKRTYKEELVWGAFFTEGKNLDKQDTFNVNQSDYEIIIKKQYDVGFESILELNDNFYSMKSGYDWLQYGFVHYKCTRMSLEDAKRLIYE